MLLPPIVLQDAPTPQTTTVVTSPRAERPITSSDANHQVVTGEELRATGERSLPRALLKTTGLFVQETNLGGGAPIIRGLIGNQILIVVDGVRLNDAATRQGPNQSLNGIDPAVVERIEVLRGPSAVLYGSDGLGGTILIWTKSRRPAGEDGDAQARRIRAVLEGEYLSVADGVRGGLEVSGATDSNGWLGVLSGQRWEDLRSGDGEVDHTGYSGQGYFGSWVHALDQHRSLRATTQITKDFHVPRTDRLNVGFGQTNPADSEHEFRLQNRQRTILAFDDHESGVLADSMQVRASFRWYQEERTIRGFGSTTRRDEQDTTTTLGLGTDFRKAIGDGHLLTYGFDVDYDEIDSTRDNININTGVVTPAAGTFEPGSRYTSSGVFLRDEITAFDAVDLTAGVRYSRYDFGFRNFATNAKTEGDFDALVGSLSAARDLTDDVRLTGTLSQGFRAPNLSELAKNSTFAGGTELANPDLDPEQSLVVELALDVRKDLWSTAFAIYRSTIDDVLGRRLIDPGGPQSGDEIYIRENTGELEIYGVEARYTRRFGVESPWSVSAVAEYTVGEQHDDFVDPSTGQKPFDGEPATRIPPLHGNLGLRYEPAEMLWRLGFAELTFAWALEQDELSPQDLSDPRVDPNGTDAWTTVDLDVGGPIGERSSWTVGLHNLLDEDYRIHGSGFDAPGFGVVVGLRLSN